MGLQKKKLPLEPTGWPSFDLLNCILSIIDLACLAGPPYPVCAPFGRWCTAICTFLPRDDSKISLRSSCLQTPRICWICWRWTPSVFNWSKWNAKNALVWRMDSKDMSWKKDKKGSYNSSCFRSMRWTVWCKTIFQKTTVYFTLTYLENLLSFRFSRLGAVSRQDKHVQPSPSKPSLFWGRAVCLNCIQFLLDGR